MNRRGFLLGAIATPVAASVAQVSATLPPLSAPTLAGVGATPTEYEFCAVMRRVFVPKLVVQIYSPSPLLMRRSLTEMVGETEC